MAIYSANWTVSPGSPVTIITNFLLSLNILSLSEEEEKSNCNVTSDLKEHLSFYQNIFMIDIHKFNLHFASQWQDLLIIGKNLSILYRWSHGFMWASRFGMHIYWIQYFLIKKKKKKKKKNQNVHHRLLSNCFTKIIIHIIKH